MRRVRAVICGDPMVGKSSLISKFGNKPPSREATVAGSFQSSFVKLDKEVVNLEVWDTAGSERYRSVIPSFFRNASIVAIVYDISDRASFDHLGFWISFSSENAPQNAKFVLIGNKSDLPTEERKVKYEEAREFAETNHALSFIETSAVTGDSIESLFSLLASAPSNPSSGTEEGAHTELSVEKKSGCC